MHHTAGNTASSCGKGLPLQCRPIAINLGQTNGNEEEGNRSLAKPRASHTPALEIHFAARPRHPTSRLADGASRPRNWDACSAPPHTRPGVFPIKPVLQLTDIELISPSFSKSDLGPSLANVGGSLCMPIGTGRSRRGLPTLAPAHFIAPTSPRSDARLDAEQRRRSTRLFSLNNTFPRALEQ